MIPSVFRSFVPTPMADEKLRNTTRESRCESLTKCVPVPALPSVALAGARVHALALSLSRVPARPSGRARRGVLPERPGRRAPVLVQELAQELHVHVVGGVEHLPRRAREAGPLQAGRARDWRAMY